jgi:hypothetical protein
MIAPSHTNHEEREEHEAQEFDFQALRVLRPFVVNPVLPLIACSSALFIVIPVS